MKIEIDKLNNIIELAEKKDMLEVELTETSNGNLFTTALEITDYPDYVAFIDSFEKLTRDELCEITALYWLERDNEDFEVDPKNWTV